MKPINPPVAIRMEFVGFDVSNRPRTKPPPRGLSGTARARPELAASSPSGRQAHRGGAARSV
jgi:hypothetical protein